MPPETKSRAPRWAPTTEPSAIREWVDHSALPILKRAVRFGYVMNLTGSSILINERPAALVTALYGSLG